MKVFFRWCKRALLVFFIAALSYQIWVCGWLVYWQSHNPIATRFMTLRLAELQKDNSKAELEHQWVGYQDISIHLKRAVVAAEDDRFMSHKGLDWQGIEAAFKKNRRRGAAVAGGSTITQQLAKNLFLSPRRSYIRKAQEAVIAWMIELLWDKRRILEVYLNVVEWGGGIFGAEAAAQHYYHLSAAHVGPTQAANLAVILPNPRRYEKHRPNWVQAHARKVQARMHYSQVPL